MLAVAAPAIEDAMARLQKKADPICGESTVSAIDSKGIAALLLPSLIARLNRIVTRTMVLELNVARIENRLREKFPRNASAISTLRWATPRYGPASGASTPCWPA